MREVQTERPAKECRAVFALYSEEHREDGRLRHGAAGSVSELKALGNQGDDRRRSLPTVLIVSRSGATSLPSRLLRENENGRLTTLGLSIRLEQ